MTNGIRAIVSSDTVSTDFGNFGPWCSPVAPSSANPHTFYNPYFYHPPEYAPPPTPPHVFHSPQPLPYYTHTPNTSPYLPDSGGIPWYSTYQHECQPYSNPYSPPLSCFINPSITATQGLPGFIFEQQPELVAPQMFDESPDSWMSIPNAIEDNCHHMEDKYTEMIQILEKMGKSLADSSKILEGISSKPVSRSSNHVSNDNLDSSGTVKTTVNVEGEDSNDSQLPHHDISAPHMFYGSPEKEYVSTDKHFYTTHSTKEVYYDVDSTIVENFKCDQKVFNASSGINLNEENRFIKLFSDDSDAFSGDEGELEGIVNDVRKEFVDEKVSDCTLEDGDDDSETPIGIYDSSVGEVNITETDESNSDVLGMDGVFVVVDTIGFENEEEKGDEEIKEDAVNGTKDESNGPLNDDTLLKDIEEWKASKFEVFLGSSSFDVEIVLDEGESTRGRISEISTLKEEVKDGDLKDDFEGSGNVEDQSCEEQYMLPEIYGLNDRPSVDSDKNLLIFDPGGYEPNKQTCIISMSKKMNRNTESELNEVAIMTSACGVATFRNDIDEEVMTLREMFESKDGVEGVSAEHGSERKIINDCSQFAIQIGDLKSIKKIYDEMCDTVNGDKNTRIAVMVKQRCVGESFEVFAYMHKKNLCSWNLKMTRYSKMRNMELARLLFDDSSGKKVEPKKKVCLEFTSIMLLRILNVSGHGGLIYELQLFRKMITACGVVSVIKHYECFIDMLGRSETLNEAENRTIDFLNKLVSVAYWRTTRVTCHLYDDAKMEERVMRKTEKMEVKYVGLHQYEFSDEGSNLFPELYKIGFLSDEFTHGSLLIGHALNYLGALSLFSELVTTKFNDKYQFVCEFEVGGPFVFAKDFASEGFRRGDYKELTSLKDFAIRIKGCQNDTNYETGSGKNSCLEHRKGGGTIARPGTLDTLNEMKVKVITLDEITNLCILSACAREGLLKKVNQNVKIHEGIYVVKETRREKGNARELSGKHIFVAACYSVIHIDIRNDKLNDAGENYFLNPMCSSSELEKFSAKIGNLVWTLKCVKEDLSLEPASEEPIVDGIYFALAGQDKYEKVFNEVGFFTINLLKFVQFPSSVYEGIANDSSIVTPIYYEQIPSIVGPVHVFHFRRRCCKIGNLSRMTQRRMNENGVLVLEEVTWQMWKKIIQHFVDFILEDKDDFKRGYLSRSSNRMTILALGLCYNPKQSPTNSKA